FFVAVTLALGADAIVRASWPSAFGTATTTTSGLMLVTLVYAGATFVVGAYVAAASSGSRPIRHAIVFGAIAFVLVGGLAGSGAWGAPAWQQLTVLVLLLPCAWLGGKLREQQLAQRLSLRAGA